MKNWITVEKCHVLLTLSNIVNGLDFTWHNGIDENIVERESQQMPFSLRRASQTQSMLYTIVCGEKSPEECGFTERDFFRALRNYGRNCFGRSEPTVFDDSKSWFHHAHYGNPIDEIDRACFHVGRAYKCMFLDHESGNLQQGASKFGNITVDGCYQGMSYSYHLNANKEIICGSENNPEYENNKWHGCRKVACEIERNFSLKASYFLQNPIEFYETAKNFSKYHIEPVGKSTDKSDVAMAMGAPRGLQNHNVSEECCGSFPERFPFMRLTHQCCDGLVKSLGSC